MKKYLLLAFILINVRLMAQNTFPASGNVGIGTTSPQTKLHVGGTLSDEISLGTTDYGGNGGQALGSIQTAEASEGYGGILVLKTLHWGSSPYAPTEKMRIDNFGNVGIGSMSPLAKLDVRGLFYIDNALCNSAKPIINFNMNGHNYGSIYDLGNSSNYVGIGGVPTPTGTPSSSAMVWGMSSGNVGIGITSPTEKLSVNGNIRSKKLIVTQTGWSDYVFDSSYQLKPLTELERFIKINKHLPDIPTAKQVEKEGIDVGENQALLLKKVEELTLYMIEMKKGIDVLNLKVRKLEIENVTISKELLKSRMK